MEKKRPTAQNPLPPDRTPPKSGRPLKKTTRQPIAGRRSSSTTGASKVARPASRVIESKPVSRPAKTARPSRSGPLDIVVVASEAHPFATTGGLAEVVGSLPQALARLGHTVTIVVPRYRKIIGRSSLADATSHRPQSSADGHAVIDFGARRQAVRFYSQPVAERIWAVFVDAPELYDREGLYGDGAGDYSDNAFRFAVFSRAALEYLRTRGARPSVIHAHDWQVGLVPVYQKMHLSNDPVVGGVPVVFTIHNLAFQGLFAAATLEEIGLPRDVLHLQAMEFYGRISYLKGGINFSERITTVSPQYAREILTREGGFGFDGVMARRANALVGILNGINTDRWNPSADPFVPSAYSADDLTGKTEAKRFLLQAKNLDASATALRRPLIGLVSRLTDQKGFDLVAAAADELMALDAAWVMLGSGERRYEKLWTSLAARYPDRVSTTIGYEERLEHLIEAGADAFLMPSYFEPCGLNQLNSLRYGTLPIVRATGGLDDTVTDRVTGFKFSDYTAEALVGAVRRALETYRKPGMWQKMQKTAMKRDYSWDVPAREYVKVYSAIS
jgi:starch synthase